MAEAVRRGHIPRLPARVEGAPTLLAGLDLYWIAYAELSTCRPSTFGGCAPIPWTACASYAQMHRLDYEQFDDLVCFVREMDKAYMKWYDRTHGSSTKKPIGEK